MAAQAPSKYRYGVISSSCPARLELEAIKNCLYYGDHWLDKTGKTAGLTLAEHTRRFAKLAWPSFKWHRWSDMLLEEICRNDTVAVWGPASSGKTATMAVVMLAWYWAVSDEFTGLVSTTDLLRLELRIFGEIKKRFKAAKERYPWLAGNLIDSRQRITTDAKDLEGRDFRNGIIGIACKKSSGENQGLADYAGIKNRFVLLAADEVHTMAPGFLQGAHNLKANNNSGRFVAIYSGNLVDIETPLGEAAEPDCGWDALPDSEVSRVYKTKSFGGSSVQFVGKDSRTSTILPEPNRSPTSSGASSSNDSSTTAARVVRTSSRKRAGPSRDRRLPTGSSRRKSAASSTPSSQSHGATRS